MKKYYAEITTWGKDSTTIIQFDTKRDRDEFCKQDYTNKVYSHEAKERGFITFNEWNMEKLGK